MDNKIKRILFVVTREEFGGAQRFLYELITRLDLKKYEALVAFGEKEKGDFLKSLNEKNISTQKLRFLKREINPIFDILGAIELIKAINRFKPDYLHLSSSKAGILGSIAGFIAKSLKFKSLKIIYRIGGWSFNDPWPWWKKRLFIWIERMTARLKDVIVVNNKHDYDQALKLKIKPRKELKLIHNGVDALKLDFLPKDEAKRKLKVSEADLTIGTIANFYPPKGLLYLIDAVHLSKNPNFKFLIIGDGEERQVLEAKIKEYDLEKEIISIGQIAEAYKYMKAFDIFVLPSVKEGFPWAVLDAMAAKLPIVATKVGALPEMIESGKNGMLVEPKNPRQLAEAIEYLAENERVRQELGLQAHQTVLFKFPVEKMVRETEELFN